MPVNWRRLSEQIHQLLEREEDSCLTFTLYTITMHHIPTSFINRVMTRGMLVG